MPMGARPGHQQLAAGAQQALGNAQILGAIGEDLEPVAAEHARGFDKTEHIGLQRVVVGDDLKLDPIRLEQLSRHLRRGNRLARRMAAGRVWQDARAQALHQLPKALAGARLPSRFRGAGKPLEPQALPLRPRGAESRARGKAPCRAAAARSRCSP